MSPLTVALVGYGYWGPNLLRNYIELPEAEVKWVCDRSPEALQKAHGRYPSVGVAIDLDVVLGDPEVDAVLVATPISTHHAIAKAALEAGKHVFVEKPMTHDVASSRELVELADREKLTLMVGHTFVYSPPVRMVQQYIDRGELGDIRYVHTSRVNLGLHQKDVSVVWDLMPHDISIIYSWLGRPAESAAAFGQGCIVPEIPDVAFVVLNFPGRVIAGAHVSWLSPVKLRSTIVVGSEKMLVYDDTENVEKVKVFDHGVDFQDPEDFGEFQLSYRTGDIVSPKIANTEPLWIEAKEFCAAVAEGRPPLTDGRAGRRWWPRWRPRSGRCAPPAAPWPSSVVDGVTPVPQRHAGRGLRPAAAVRGRQPPRGAGEGERPLAVGAGAVVRPFTTIYAGSVIGARLQTGQGASIREDNYLGDDVSVGTNAVLEFGNRIGSRVRIHSGCFLELVTIEDDVFVGPNVVFTDDPHPMNCPRYEDCKGGATVHRMARIGANSTILPGVRIGEGALVGAGSVVVHDVPPGAVVVGNPAQVIKQVADLTCAPGWFERPYCWPPYCEPQEFDPGELCDEVVERLHVAERYRPPQPR